MPRASKAADKTSPQVFQFKITLCDITPKIWRRIQVPDGTLDKLHEQIQTAFGWTNSHLHQFHIDERRCGDPKLLLEDCEDQDAIVDSTKLSLSELLQKRRKSFRFFYEYDFGDSWLHEIVYEGTQPAAGDASYPCCTAGARACPPEDVGGPWGYVDFLDAVRDPKHESHEEVLEWAGEFDPEAFDPDEATKQMHRGLPNWCD